MTGIDKLLAKRIKQYVKAKEKTISAKVAMGMEKYLTDWLVETQKRYGQCINTFERHMLLTEELSNVSEVVTSMHKNVSVELTWCGSDESDETLKLDGIRATWVDENNNQRTILIDSTYLMLKQMGIE